MAIFNSIKIEDLEIHKKKDPITNKIHTYEKEVKRTIGLKEWQKEELPTTRFWLMLKIRDDAWTKRWLRYLTDTKAFLISQFIGDPDEINAQVSRIMEKLERSAWNTMPSSFLQNVGIPRVVRR